MSVKTQLVEVFTKLTQLKIALNKYSEGLSIEEYAHLYGDIEELQGLVSDVMEGVREYNMVV